VTGSPFDGLAGRDVDREALELAWLTGSEGERRDLERLAGVLRHGIAGDRRPLLEPPPVRAGGRSKADGAVRLGRIIHGSSERDLGWLGVGRDELCRHLLMVGRTGSGKSTLAVGMLRQLMEQGVPWVALDHKRSLRALLAIDLPRPVQVCALGRHLHAALRFNPLCPPRGVPFETHRRQVVELLCDSWFAGDGVAALLDRAIVKAAALTGPRFPTFSEVRKVVEGMLLRDREALWRQSALRILEQLTTGQLGRVLNARRDAVAIDALMSHWSVLELDGLSAVDSSFLIGHLLRHLANGLLAGAQREVLRLVVFCDEAHHILRKHETARESIAETLMREAREVGLGIVLATQSFQGLSGIAIANAGTLVAMHLMHRTDLQAAGQALLLKDEQRDLLSLLNTGEAVVRRSEGWPRPVLIRAQPMELPKGAISDTHITRSFLLGPYSRAALDERAAGGDSSGSAFSGRGSPPTATSGPVQPMSSADMREIRGGPIEREGEGSTTGINTNDTTAAIQANVNTSGAEARELGLSHAESVEAEGDGADPAIWTSDQEALEGIEDPPLIAVRERSGSAESGESLSSGLPAEAESLLRHIAMEPLVGVSARYLALGLSRRKGDAAKAILISEQLAQPVDVVTPSGKTVLLSPTEAGRAWLARRRIPTAAVRASPIHAWWQERCITWFREHGWHASAEHVIAGHAFDVYAERGAGSTLQSVLLEIETGRSSWLLNMQMLGTQTLDHRAVLWLDRASIARATAAAPECVRVLTPTTVRAWIREISHEPR
jgi:hypothetical protein